MWLERAIKCMYCWKIDHYFERHCQVFPDNLNSNWIHLEDENEVYFRTYKSEVRLVYMRQNKSRRKSVADAKKLQYLSLLHANVQTLKIRELKPNPYFSNEKIEFIFLMHLLMG